MNSDKQFYEDKLFGKRLLISYKADQTELDDNIRVARKQVINEVIEKLRT